ncbi:MAG: TolC family protein [Gemmatimonadales bacterium]
MRFRLFATAMLAIAQAAGAQSSVGPTLTLDDALSLAKKNNPLYLQSLNGRDRAGTALRSAYGTLLPSASSSFQTGFRQGKPQFFGGVQFGANSDQISSSWGLSFNYSISAGALNALKAFKAQVDASDRDVTGSEQALRASVTQQYIAALQLTARAELQDSLVLSNQLQLDLAKAKAGVGAATSLDVKRAEVAIGQNQVASLRAHNLADVAVLQLFQLLGVAMPPSVKLTSTFRVDEPKLDVAQLLDLAGKDNPALRALQSREEAASSSYRAAQSLYSPTLSLSAQLGGNAQQYTNSDYLVNQSRSQTAQSQASCFVQDSLRRGAGMPSIAGVCNNIVFTDAQAQSIRAGNSNFPFRFTSNPYTLSAGLSLPLFDGFTREQRVEDAASNRSDARYNVRAQQLKLTADVTSAYTTVVADYRAVRQQEINSARALEALQLAQERYRVGLNSLVDLQAARADYQQAESDRIDAIYEYHRAYSALESAVGRPLR